MRKQEFLLVTNSLPKEVPRERLVQVDLRRKGENGKEGRRGEKRQKGRKERRKKEAGRKEGGRTFGRSLCR